MQLQRLNQPTLNSRFFTLATPEMVPPVAKEATTARDEIALLAKQNGVCFSSGDEIVATPIARPHSNLRTPPDNVAGRRIFDCGSRDLFKAGDPRFIPSPGKPPGVQRNPRVGRARRW